MQMETAKTVARLKLVETIPFVDVEGEVDIGNSHVLDDVLRGAGEFDAGAVVVSLEHTSYFDSAAIHVLIRNRSRLATSRQAFLIVEPRLSAGRRVLEIAGLLRGESVFSTADDAFAEAKRLHAERRPA